MAPYTSNGATTPTRTVDLTFYRGGSVPSSPTRRTPPVEEIDIYQRVSERLENAAPAIPADEALAALDEE